MRKLNFFHRYEIVKIMQWLNEQASYGWELKEWGNVFVKFEETSGSRCQYQLDMDNWEDGANEERRGELEALAWKYVDTIGGTKIHIYRSEDLKASIPPNEVFITYHQKRLKITPILGIIGFLVTISAFMIPIISNIPYTLIELSKINKYAIPFAIFFAGLIVLQYFNNILDDWRLYQYLDSIREVPVLEVLCQDDYRNDGVSFKIINWILCFIGAVCLLGFAFTEDERNLADANRSTKYVNLVEFQDEKFSLGEVRYTNSKEINRANYISYENSPFAEEYYEVKQFGHDFLGVDEHLEGQYWINVEKKVQEELYSQIMDRYTSYHYHYELFRKDTYDTRGLWVISEQTDERFDRLVFAQGLEEFSDTRLLFVQMGDHIVYLMYRGEKDISVLIEELEKTF